MSRWPRKRKTKRSTSKSDGSVGTLDAVDGLLELGPAGLAIAVFGGAVAVIAGVFKFMRRGS